MKAKSETRAKKQTAPDVKSRTEAEAWARKQALEDLAAQTRVELESDANTAVNDAGERIQGLDSRTDVGVNATATTKVDVR